MHGAGAALPMIAALLRPGQVHRLANAIQQSSPRINPQLAILPVDTKRDRNGPFNPRPVRGSHPRPGCRNHRSTHAPGNGSSRRRPRRRLKKLTPTRTRWRIVSHRNSVRDKNLIVRIVANPRVTEERESSPTRAPFLGAAAGQTNPCAKAKSHNIGQSGRRRPVSGRRDDHRSRCARLTPFMKNSKWYAATPTRSYGPVGR